jgi:hypothetical protein
MAGHSEAPATRSMSHQAWDGPAASPTCPRPPGLAPAAVGAGHAWSTRTVPLPGLPPLGCAACTARGGHCGAPKRPLGRAPPWPRPSKWWAWRPAPHPARRRPPHPPGPPARAPGAGLSGGGRAVRVPAAPGLTWPGRHVPLGTGGTPAQLAVAWRREACKAAGAARGSQMIPRRVVALCPPPPLRPPGLAGRLGLEAGKRHGRPRQVAAQDALGGLTWRVGWG